ncbi:hypothetical protein ON010_g13137 [Phytophthora cinnamomi]|nr:hypothetical protein ON010_g13137 [Phytophthora cinnamomi]
MDPHKSMKTAALPILKLATIMVNQYSLLALEAVSSDRQQNAVQPRPPQPGGEDSLGLPRQRLVDRPCCRVRQPAGPVATATRELALELCSSSSLPLYAPSPCRELRRPANSLGLGEENSKECCEEQEAVEKLLAKPVESYQKVSPDFVSVMVPSFDSPTWSRSRSLPWTCPVPADQEDTVGAQGPAGKRTAHRPGGRSLVGGQLPALTAARWTTVALQFERQALSSIAVYAVQPLGVPSDDIEAESGPSLCTVLSHTTENLLFGSSLRASQSFMDCLSDHRSGYVHQQLIAQDATSGLTSFGFGLAARQIGWQDNVHTCWMNELRV